MNRFCRFDLRTTDADQARVFYKQVLGHDRSTIWPLHEQARARGAPPHWLGQIGVDDPEATAAAFVACGATQLGPKVSAEGRGTWITVRDPGGAVVALATRSDAPVDVVFHVLSTNDPEAAAKRYREVVGLDLDDRIMIAGIEGRPGVHPHWLFFFPVGDLDAAIATARSLGAKALEPTTMPDGRRTCVLDDPQGAAFGLVSGSPTAAGRPARG